MDYNAIDRDMSSWVVSCVRNGTRFYLTEQKVASDILSRAARFRYNVIAAKVADLERDEKAWEGFDWQAMSVPEAIGGNR